MLKKPAPRRRRQKSNGGMTEPILREYSSPDDKASILHHHREWSESSSHNNVERLQRLEFEIPEVVATSTAIEAGDVLDNSCGATSRTAQSEQSKALNVALHACWKLCCTSMESTLENSIGFAEPRRQREQARRECWRFCQQLYGLRDSRDPYLLRPMIKQCRDFCQALLDTKPDNEGWPLRVSFELNNHLFETRISSPPEPFDERLLGSYTELCRRLMQPVSDSKADFDANLWNCWCLVEVLLNMRQSNILEGIPGASERSYGPIRSISLDFGPRICKFSSVPTIRE